MDILLWIIQFLAFIPVRSNIKILSIYGRIFAYKQKNMILLLSCMYTFLKVNMKCNMFAIYTFLKYHYKLYSVKQQINAWEWPLWLYTRKNINLLLYQKLSLKRNIIVSSILFLLVELICWTMCCFNFLQKFLTLKL